MSREVRHKVLPSSMGSGEQISNQETMKFENLLISVSCTRVDNEAVLKIRQASDGIKIEFESVQMTTALR